MCTWSVTTDADNVASRRVIEANGGELVERFFKPAYMVARRACVFAFSLSRRPGSIQGERAGSVCNLRKLLEDVLVEGGEREAALHCQFNEQCVVHCGPRAQRSG